MRASRFATFELVDTGREIQRRRLPASQRPMAVDRAGAIDQQRTGKLAPDALAGPNADQRRAPRPDDIRRHPRRAPATHRVRQPERLRWRDRDERMAAIGAALRARDLLHRRRARGDRRLDQRLRQLGRLARTPWIAGFFELGLHDHRHRHDLGGLGLQRQSLAEQRAASLDLLANLAAALLSGRIVHGLASLPRFAGVGLSVYRRMLIGASAARRLIASDPLNAFGYGGRGAASPVGVPTSRPSTATYSALRLPFARRGALSGDRRPRGEKIQP